MQSPETTGASASNSRTALRSDSALTEVSLGRIRGTVHKIQNHQKEHWRDMLRFHLTILPFIWRHCIVFTIWAALVCIFALVAPINFLQWLPQSIIFSTVVGVSLSLMLAFRLNTAYDRFWEGRRYWSSIHATTLNVARLIKIFIKATTDQEESSKSNALRLLTGFAQATKHALRQEFHADYEDLAPHIDHMHNFAQGRATVTRNIPSDTLSHLHAYLLGTNQPVIVPILAGISSLEDSYTHLERIGNTPIPQSQSIQLDQILLAYLLALPFQLVRQVGWYTVPIVCFTAYLFIGIDAISDKIENPFMFFFHNLPMDDFCLDIQSCIDYIDEQEGVGVSPLNWVHSYDMKDSDVHVHHGGVENSAAHIREKGSNLRKWKPSGLTFRLIDRIHD
ncbi:Bestrophin, RFP-TM, chloride channel-domain-containing protein [Chytriomyces sp. MP71]|nr:Bestrophin, RFP-TM, chloride channel-domain-containing protein [Chytriomyces sp. MP71]